MSDLTPATIFEEMGKKLAADPASVAGMNAVYQFKVTGDGGGDWYADLKATPPAVAAGVHPSANCTITVAGPDFVNIKSGKLSGQMAFMTGKLKIAGDMGLAMKLQKILS
jgi:putative sterol carrier protein